MSTKILYSSVPSGRSVASGIQLELLFEEVENILIANNTLLDCSRPMRVWEDIPIGHRIEARAVCLLQRA